LDKKEEQTLPGSRGMGVGGVEQTMYTHVSKCRNNKIKGEKRKRKKRRKLRR
jgi:hypothetical protein